MYEITLKNLIINYMNGLHGKANKYRDFISIFNSQGNEKFRIKYEYLKGKDVLQLIIKNYDRDDVYTYGVYNINKLLNELLFEIN